MGRSSEYQVQGKFTVRCMFAILFFSLLFFLTTCIYYLPPKNKISKKLNNFLKTTCARSLPWPPSCGGCSGPPEPLTPEAPVRSSLTLAWEPLQEESRAQGGCSAREC